MSNQHCQSTVGRRDIRDQSCVENGPETGKGKKVIFFTYVVPQMQIVTEAFGKQSEGSAIWWWRSDLSQFVIKTGFVNHLSLSTQLLQKISAKDSNTH